MSVTDAKRFETEESTEEEKVVQLRKHLLDKGLLPSIFGERKEFLTGKYDYPRNGNDPGLLLIFNQVNFRNSNDHLQRKGSWRDVNQIKSCFADLGYFVQDEHTDLTKREIIETIKQVTSRDLTEVNCLVVFFLTHGTTKNRIMAKDGPFSLQYAWDFFDKCESLKHKPKLFVIQACKGRKQEKTKTSRIVPYTTFSLDASMPDTVVAYCTVEGFVSFRDPLMGTWFVQELCKNISMYGRHEDVVSILLKASRAVAMNYKSSDGSAQMPVFVSTLNKRFYLARGAERSLVLDVDQKVEDILNRIKDFNENLHIN